MRLLALAALVGAVVAAPADAATVTVTVRDRAGPLAEAVVALEPVDAPAPAALVRADVDQVNKRFIPRISVVRTGTSVSFPNSDRIRHEVYSFSPTKTFTLKLYAGRAAPPVVFDRPGLVVLDCNIHDTMVGFIAVVDTPYFGRTDSSGVLALNAPAGRYRLRVWHPDLDQPVPLQPLTLTAEAKPIAVEVSRAPNPSTVAPWSD